MRLETYPETRSARLVGTNAEINLYRLARAPEISQKGVIFEGMGDGFSPHLVVTPESGIGLAFGSFPGDVGKEPEKPLRASIPQVQENVPVTPEPAAQAARSALETTPTKPEKEKPQKFFGVIAEAPRLARRKRDNEPYARFLLDLGDVDPKSEPVPVMLTKKWSEAFRQQVEDKELGKGTAVVVVGFPKERTVVKQGQAITERWINGLKVKPL
jgi:hypothetical protein